MNSEQKQCDVLSLTARHENTMNACGSIKKTWSLGCETQLFNGSSEGFYLMEQCEERLFHGVHIYALVCVHCVHCIKHVALGRSGCIEMCCMDNCKSSCLSGKDQKVQLAHLGGQVLLSRESFSECTEAMLDQVIQITCNGTTTFFKCLTCTLNTTCGSMKPI